MKCPYCGCNVEDHPEISVPLGSFTCCDCGNCPLTQEHLKKILGKQPSKEQIEFIKSNFINIRWLKEKILEHKDCRKMHHYKDKNNNQIGVMTCLDVILYEVINRVEKNGKL